jgi:hypothetical protein
MSLEGVTLGLAEMQCLPPAGVAVVCGSLARESALPIVRLLAWRRVHRLRAGCRG